MWKWLRCVFSALLLSTSIVKLFSIDAILRSNGLLASPAILSVAIAFEIFAAYFIAVATPLRSFQFTSLTFFVFAMFSISGLVLGQDCNCLGGHTPSGFPLAVDILCLLMLARCKTVDNAQLIKLPSISVLRSWQIHCVALWGSAFFGLALFFLLQNSQPIIPVWFGTNLIGLSFPLDNDPRVKQLLRDDREWNLVLLRPDCEHCREISSRWRDGATTMDAKNLIGVSLSKGRWTFMPNSISSSAIFTKQSFDVHWDNGFEPAVETPTLITVTRRQVTNVLVGDDAVDLILGVSSEE